MTQRISYGTLAIVALVTIFTLDVRIAEDCRTLEGPIGDLLRRGSILPLTVLALVLRGAYEANRLLLATGATPHSRFAYLMIAALILTPWLSAAGWLGDGVREVEGLFWQVIGLAAAGIGVSILTVLRRQPEGTSRDVGATFFLIFFLGFMLSFALQLRCGRDVPGEEGVWLLLITALITKSADIGGYLIGSTMGRHKLIPAISPGKSVEGTIGGLAAGALVAVLLVQAGVWTAGAIDTSRFAQIVQKATASFGSVSDAGGLAPLPRAFIFGVLVSAAGQIGDLFESCLKRDARIKDSGKIIPSFGGILDLIDSPIVSVPVAWFLLTVVWNVV